MYIRRAMQAHGKQYALYATDCNWKNMTVGSGRVLPVRANRIEKSDVNFALFAHVTRLCADSLDNSKNIKKKRYLHKSHKS